MTHPDLLTPAEVFDLREATIRAAEAGDIEANLRAEVQFLERKIEVVRAAEGMEIWLL